MSPFPPSYMPFAASLWISARLMPVFAKSAPIGELLRMATPNGESPAYAALDAGEIVASVKRVTRRPWRMRGRRCLREGLLAFRFLSLAGHRPLLHFAVEKETLRTDRPRAHCWISVGDEVLMNPPSPTMLELFAYDGSESVPAGAVNVSEAARFG
jgi:transglutaminase superfamily protein